MVAANQSAFFSLTETCCHAMTLSKTCANWQRCSHSFISMYLQWHSVAASTSYGSQTHLEPIRLDIGDYLIG
jgi:hypothetical protein